MKEIKPLSEAANVSHKADLKHADGFHLVENEDGTLHCSCGKAMKQRDKNTLMCEGGPPTYTIDAGDVVFDKFGNMMLKNKPIEH